MSGFEFVLLGAAVIFVFVRLAVLLKALLNERQLLSPGAAPTAEDLRTGRTMAPKGNRHFDWLIGILCLKARAGVLQEEPILDELEDKLYGNSWFREFPSICILLALAWTFFNLKNTLPSIIGANTITPKSLTPILSLVGANWWLIAGGLLFHFGSLGERRLNTLRFDGYRSWLERDIIPQLGLARTTGDRLTSALESFGSTVREIREAIYPLSGLASVMQSFQEGLVAEMIPAMSKGLEGVKIGLSDTALGELQKTTVESTRALREMKDQQARMLTLVVSGERRATELATLVQSIADQTGAAASALREQAGLLGLNSQALNGLKTEIHSSIASSSALRTGVAQLGDSISSHSERLDSNTSSLSGLVALLPATGATLAELQTLIAGIQLGLAGLAVSENSLRTELEQSRLFMSEASASLSATLGNAADLKRSWEEALLQMTSLVDEVSRRTKGFETSATELTAAAGAIASGLPGIQAALDGVGAKVEGLGGSTAEIAVGNKALVNAFSDLHATSKKLKHLGSEVTGHFNIWQDQTRKVYDKAQDSTEKIEACFTRIGGLVGGMEGVLREVAERGRRDLVILNGGGDVAESVQPNRELIDAVAAAESPVVAAGEHLPGDAMAPPVI